VNQSERDIFTLARTIWGEARGELHGGRVAVANVIINRFKKRGWWAQAKNDRIEDNTIEAVCRAPWQFSCWNKDDPNLPYMLALTEDDKTFMECLNIARDAETMALPDITFRSKHYHNLTVSPKWAEDKTPIIQVGNHLFFNNVE